MKHMPDHNPFVPALLALAFVAVATVSGISAVTILNAAHDPQAAAAAAAFPAPLMFDGAALASDAAVVYDPTNGYVLFAKNSASLPLSIVKDTSALSTTTQTAAALKSLRSVPGITSAATYGSALPRASLRVVFDAEIGHPLVAVVVGGSPQEQSNDIARLINASRR